VRVNLAGFDLARARAGAGDRAGALQTLQGIRPDDPGDLQSWEELGKLALQLQSPSLAASFFDEAIRVAPRAAKPRQDMGLALAMMGRYEEAIAQFRQGIAADPTDAAAHLNLAVALAEAGRPADARTHAREALRLKPDYERARLFLKALKCAAEARDSRSFFCWRPAVPVRPHPRRIRPVRRRSGRRSC
jgi:tetratricopeptide (TPR) repeat protein